MKKWLLFSLFLIGTLGPSVGQDEADTTSIAPVENISTLTLWGHYGSIFAHSVEVHNTAGSHPAGVHLDWGKQWYGAGSWMRYGCLPRTGVTLAYYDYDNAVLGRSLTAAYYLEPTFPLSSRVLLGVRGAAGLSWLSNPYHPERNPTNMSYSTALSAYLSLGVSTYYRINQQWALALTGDYQHVSNGGFRQPNKGINWPTVGLGVDYAIRPVVLKRPANLNRQQNWRASESLNDLYVFGGVQNVAAGESQQYPLIGGGITIRKQIGRTNTITAGVEAYKDYALKEKLARDTLTHLSSLRAGGLLGHEFLLGKVTFSQQLGIYLFRQAPYYPLLYHRWGLLYQLNRSYSAGVNLKVHGHVANFWDLRLVRHW
ncbi:acyloxyacyl hydrolase [Telluribacter humicola]|uniref:acyloxyacyl hydrolase n=1 Tax=Telluribacter humicola TaxID=1720261 RepID=UPI001A975350|nr:acyloxyacyl hydrolase [Telluribacter humicola]